MSAATHRMFFLGGPASGTMRFVPDAAKNMVVTLRQGVRFAVRYIRSEEDPTFLMIAKSVIDSSTGVETVVMNDYPESHKVRYEACKQTSK